MDITEKIASVSNKEDFIAFLRSLSANFKKNPQTWKNVTVDEYLDAIASWVEDFSECPRNDVDWDSVDYALILRLLYVGSIYE